MAGEPANAKPTEVRRPSEKILVMVFISFSQTRIVRPGGARAALPRKRTVEPFRNQPGATLLWTEAPTSTNIRPTRIADARLARTQGASRLTQDPDAAGRTAKQIGRLPCARRV